MECRAWVEALGGDAPWKEREKKRLRRVEGLGDVGGLVEAFPDLQAYLQAEEELQVSDIQEIALCRTPFGRVSKVIAKRIARTKRDILAAAAVYSDVHAGKGGLTDEQRDAFDSRIAHMLDAEQQTIAALKDLAELGPGSTTPAAGSLKAHCHSIIESLTEAKQDLTNIVSEMQMLRMRQTISAKEVLFTQSTTGVLDASLEQLLEQDKLRDLEREKNAKEEQGLRRRKNASKPLNNDSNHNNKKDSWANVPNLLDDWDGGNDSDEDDIDEDTMKQLAQEQSTLSAQLHEEMHQAMQAEKQMEEFSELAELFSQKLAEQHGDIISLENDVGESTEFMNQASDQLISAKEHNKSFRKYVIVFFSIATGMLLLMDAMD